MSKISAAIITFNEEKNIERCITSLRNVADEVVIIDSGSTDRTVEIAKDLKATIFTNPFKGHIQQKNFAITKTQYDWVISLDADEALSEELTASILAVKENLKGSGYIFSRLTNYCGKWIKHCGWYPDAKTRLWRKGTAKWEGSIHEKLKSQLPIKSIKGDILHYSYPSISFHLSKINHFTDFMAKEMLEKGKKGSLIKLIVSPPFKFLKKYIFQLGFLDGYAGFIVSTMAAYYVFVKYAKLRILIKRK